MILAVPCYGSSTNCINYNKWTGSFPRDLHSTSFMDSQKIFKLSRKIIGGIDVIIISKDWKICCAGILQQSGIHLYLFRPMFDHIHGAIILSLL